MAASDSDQPAVGIDLGTTYSCVAVYQNKRVKVITNDKGNRTMPSCVSFTDASSLIGEDAKIRLSANPCNTVYGVKRLLGKTFDDEKVQKDMAYWPFTVIDHDGKPKIEVSHQGSEQFYLPEQISGKVLGKMKQIAEEHIGKEVTKAVITVPAHFDGSQRQATIDAARLAGLEVLTLINEPTAAALAFGYKEKSTEKRKILVFDLGGGTFDVTILSIEGSMFVVLGTGGDTHLGGSDFDNMLAETLLNRFNKKHALDEAVTTNIRSKKTHRLIGACEFAKCILSESANAEVSLPDFHEGQDFYWVTNQEEFGKVNEDLFRKTIKIVANVLRDVNLNPADIDEVLLVGGSTRIPEIQQLLQELFPGKQLNQSINPDEAVAVGAAIQAAELTGKLQNEEHLLLDVISLSLGIQKQGGIFLKMIERNSHIPTIEKQTGTTAKDNQTTINMGLYQGEREMAQDNHFLGDFILKDVPPAPQGVPQIEVTFELDVNGILKATAKDLGSGKASEVEIDHNKAKVSEEELSSILATAAKYKQEDLKEKERVQAMNELESQARWLKYLVTNHSKDLKQKWSVKNAILTKSKEILKWLTHNQNQKCKQYKEKLNSLQLLSSSLPQEYLQPGKLPGATATRYINDVQSFNKQEEDDYEIVGDID